MSVADQVGKSPTPGPAGVVQLVIGLGNAILTQNRKKQYKIDGVKVSKQTFGGGGGGNVLQQAAAAAARIARPGGQVSTAPPPMSDEEFERLNRKYGRRSAPPKKPPPKPNTPPPDLNLPPTTLPKEFPTTAVQRARARIAVPPRATAKTLQFAGKWLRAAGWTGTIIYTVEWIAEKWAEYFPGRPLPDGPPPPRGGTGSQGGKGTQRPQLPPQIIFNPVINVNVPGAGGGSSGPRGSSSTSDRLSPIKITAKRIPSPPLTQVKITAKRLPIPAPAPSVYSTLLSKYGSTALPLLGGLLRKDKAKKKKARATPTPSVPGLTPGIDPGLGLAPSVADYPLYSGGSYFDSTPTQSTCDCGPKKRKRGPKKKRTTCYTGRFTERANGLRKYEKRKIKCR